jgi:uncharacterized protein
MVRLILLAIVCAAALAAQGLDFVKSTYTKYEFQIPMRDGKRLFTAVYTPKNTAQTYPILITRTPYSVAPYGTDNYRTALGPSEKFGRELFIFVYQDVRGCNLSEGDFRNMTPQHAGRRGPQDTDESTDAWDTIDWLIKNVPNNNGNAGMWGISYPGFYTSAGLINAHPALKAASPQAPIADWFIGDDFHHNGVLYLAHMYRFFDAFGHPRPVPTLPRPFTPGTNRDAYSFFLNMGPLTNINEKYFKNDVPFWTEMTQHPAYDEYWQARDLRPHLKNIKPAVMTVGGWFDAEDLFGALSTYRAIEKNSPGANNMLVMGPWFHGGWARSDGDKLGFVNFNAKTSLFYRDEIEFPFFNFWLKGKGDPKLPEALVFETGTNQWRREDAWPPKSARERSLYLHPAGPLSFDPPAESVPAFDEYISDPNKPVPYINGQASGMTREHMVEDQRFAASRADVLTWQTPVLENDVTLAGPITASLLASTTGSDSDFVVKLIDVYPEDFPDPDPNPAGIHMGGFQQLVRGEAMRGRFRNSFTRPEPFTPGKMEKVEWTLPDIDHCFRRGHRIMVQVQSSWFPLTDRNPQKFVDIYNAKATDFTKATQRIYKGSKVTVSVR